MEAAGVGIPESTLDFSFGFDAAKYSDRTLLLEIIDDLPTTAPRGKTISITSLILAARSPVFRKLFSNGMRESEEKNVKIQIEASEEISFMDLLKYVYSNNLPTDVNALLDLCVIADKFEVSSCLRDCSRSLQTLQMTCESASHYLDLPPSLLTSHTFQPLVDAAKLFLASHFQDFDRSKEEMLHLPLVGIQAVLSNDDLEVTSESEVFDSVLHWVRYHYPNLEEGQKILKTHLLHLVRFPFMTTTELTEVQTCSDIDPELATKIVIRALCFKAGTPHQKRCLAAEEEDNSTASRQFVERAYKRRPVKLVELVLPHQQCIVYLHFTREQLITHIFPKGRIMSETFHLGNQELFFFGRCYTTTDERQYFWLALKVVGSAIYTVNYEIQLRMNPREKFESWGKGSHTFTEQERYKCLNLVPWNEFIGDDSPYFINDVLHVRAELTIKK
ncbi:hypothetical protein ACS0TY_004190 [Phlomoides rotata]